MKKKVRKVLEPHIKQFREYDENNKLNLTQLQAQNLERLLIKDLKNIVDDGNDDEKLTELLDKISNLATEYDDDND